MRHFARYFFLTVLLVPIASSRLFSQDKNFSVSQATELVIKNAAALSLSPDGLKDFKVTDAYEDHIAGTKMVYVQQVFKDLPVYNVIKSVAFKNDKPVSNMGSFVSKPFARVNIASAQPSVTTGAAVMAATASINSPAGKQQIAVDTAGNKTDFSTLGLARENITAKLLWVPVKDRRLILCWQVKFLPLRSSDSWIINVDALNLSIVSKHNLTVNDNWDNPSDKNSKTAPGKQKEQANYTAAYRSETSTTEVNTAGYRVIPYPAMNINDAGGTTSIVTNPWQNAGAGNAAVTLGWHSNGAVTYDSTRGNNVWAREDTRGNNGNPIPGAAAKSTTPAPGLTFDFPFDSTISPGAGSNQKFAITQLFYWNNIMHDLSYQYGFDEAAGNFQDNNLNRGGQGNDYVIAEAQDGSGTNNANFYTPADGSRPRMQMYLWSPSSRKTLFVNTPSSLAGIVPAKEGSLSNANRLSDKGPITGEVALYYSAADSNSLACTALTGNALAGKIALLDRGTCDFSLKVKNAQLAGAIGVIVVNTSDALYTMSGSDNSITIPAVMVSLNKGNAIKAALQAGQTVNVTLEKSVEIDGDLDNGIMGHEYTHGISNRLTGGPSNATCLVNDEQLGEGWSDYFSLMVTTNWATAQVTDGPKPRPVGGYVQGEYSADGGFRTFPYSTDLAIDPWTYEDLATHTGGEVHNIGEIWTSVLWDMTWNLIQTDGINKNLYEASATGGNSAAMKLVTEAMKLQPCYPGFIDARNAILKADTLLYSGKYSCAIWRAFGRRGMGLNAIEGSPDDYTDQVADYNTNAAVVKKTADKVVAASNETITYTLSVDCKCGPVSGYKLADTLASNVTYISGGAYNAANRTVTFAVPVLQSNQTQSFALKVAVNNNSYTNPETLLNEDFSSANVPVTFSATTNNSTAMWQAVKEHFHTPDYALKAADADEPSTQELTSATAFSITGISTLSFWHYFDTEQDYDGGVVQILPDSLSEWIDAGKYFVKNGYNTTVSKRWFSGSSGGLIQSVINLSAFKNKKIKIRFVFTSDEYVGADGWYIDDIVLKNEAGVYNNVQLFTAGDTLASSSDTVTLITNGVLPLAWGSFTAEKQGTSGLLGWTTLQEQNTDRFFIEKSLDGEHFETIGSVKANGNSSLPVAYHFMDAALKYGINYYRIRQVDKDGLSSYSVTRNIRYIAADGSIVITPNPAKDKVSISIEGNTQPVQVTLLTSKAEKAGSFTMNGEYMQLDITGYPPGTYYIQLTGKNISTTRKLVVQ